MTGIDLKKFENDLASALAMNKRTISIMAIKPATAVLNLEEVTIDKIKDYFRTLHSQEWARRSIASDDNMEDAAEWFKAELNKFYSFICSTQSN